MEHSSLKCIDIAFKSGFNSVAAFNRWFLKLTGMTPNGFRHSLKKRKHAVEPSQKKPEGSNSPSL